MADPVALAEARQELDVLRKAQLIQNASGAAGLEARKAVADRVMQILYENNILEEAESSD